LKSLGTDGKKVGYNIPISSVSFNTLPAKNPIFNP